VAWEAPAHAVRLFPGYVPFFAHSKYQTYTSRKSSTTLLRCYEQRYPPINYYHFRPPLFSMNHDGDSWLFSSSHSILITAFYSYSRPLFARNGYQQMLMLTHRVTRLPYASAEISTGLWHSWRFGEVILCFIALQSLHSWQVWCMISLKFIMLGPSSEPVSPSLSGPHNDQSNYQWPQEMHWLKKTIKHFHCSRYLLVLFISGDRAVCLPMSTSW
jgi:hypothetical protein